MTERLTVDLASPIGAFRGGAAGTLYGLGDHGVPTRAILNGAHVTTTSQKPPFGEQHPSGDALAVEEGFFAKHGRDMYVYLQDLYPDWPYNGGARPGDDSEGRWTFLAIAEKVAHAVAASSARPGSYVLVPFNEPDGGNWYPDWPAQREQFLADWLATVEVLRDAWASHGLGRPRIGGPGDMEWQPERSADFLEFCVANDCLPDVFIWHELGIGNLGTFRFHIAEYRELERRLGVAPIEVNITEFGMLRDMSVPGQLVQWFALFEEAKVDAQVAYWNYAGNLSDNSARAHGANGGWWLWKWYGDLEGSVTVQVDPPQPNVPDTLQGIAAVDAAARRATVLLGGAGGDVDLMFTGLDPTVFGDRVDVAVRETRLSGVDGLHPSPPVVAEWREVPVVEGRFKVRVPVSDSTSAYQVLVTRQHAHLEGGATQAWSTTIQAETTELTGAGVRTFDPQANDGWQFLASGNADVVGFTSPASAATWRVTVPGSGTYRFQLIGAAAGEPSQLALFADGRLAGMLDLPAGLALNETSRGLYRGSAEAVIRLAAGEHELTVRRSADGTELLPGADVTLDRFVLMAAGNDKTRYPGATFRPVDGGADLYISAWETGYHEVSVSADEPARVEVALDGCPAGHLDAEPGVPGRMRVHLVQGITEIELRGADVSWVSVTRAPGADADRVVLDVDRQGSEVVIPRTGAIAAPGPHHVVVTYANAETVGTHDYNPQVVDRFLDVFEGDNAVGRAGFRYTYSWANFWDRALPVRLATADAPLRLVAPHGEPPVVRRVIVAPLRAAH